MDKFEHPDLGTHEIGVDAPLWPLALVLTAMVVLLVTVVIRGLA